MAREMKDSGIEWIGEIPCEWDIKRLKNLAVVIRGGSPRPIEDYLSTDDTGYNWIRIGDSKKGSKYIDSTARKIIPDGIYKTRLVKKGSLILSNSMSFGQPYILKIDGCIHDGWVALSDIIIHKEFMYYFLISESARSQFQYQVAGGVVQNLNIDKIGSTFLPIPDYKIQQSIADFLDAQCAHIDSVIEKTRAAVEEYKKLKQAVITQAVTKGIRPNREMKDSGIEWIGEVPSAFVCRKLKSLALLISKGATPKDISIELDNRHIVRFLKSENIVDNHLKENPEFRITTDIHEGELKRSVLSENDILFVIAGASIGKTAVMEIGLLPANTNQAVSFIRIESKYCFAKKYIWYFLQSEIVKRFIFLFAVQSAQPNLSMENLGSIRMPFPKSKEEVLEIITYLDEKTAAIDSLIQKKEQLITELEAYKKSLIYEYVTGKKEAPAHAH